MVSINEKLCQISSILAPLRIIYAKSELQPFQQHSANARQSRLIPNILFNPDVEFSTFREISRTTAYIESTSCVLSGSLSSAVLELSVPSINTRWPYATWRYTLEHLGSNIQPCWIPALCSDTGTGEAHHDDVMTWKRFLDNWPFVKGIHRWTNWWKNCGVPVIWNAISIIQG